MLSFTETGPNGPEAVLAVPLPYAGLALVALAIAVVFGLLLAVGARAPSSREPGAWQKQLGLDKLPVGIFWTGASLWGALATLLAAGLVLLILDVIVTAMPAAESSRLGALWDGMTGQADGTWDFRFRLAQLAVLTTVLGAVIALPLTLTRIRLTREQTDTAQDALFNDKIAQAAADLHAQRQVTRWTGDKAENGWADDVARRNAAIDRLEGLVRERPEEADRVARLLSVYVRELSRELPPEPVPKDLEWHDGFAGKALGEWRDRLRGWAWTLKPARSDMENAVKVLGRLTETAGLAENTLPIDLSGANLKGFDVRRLDLRNADMRAAQMQGANLFGAQMQGANLFGAQMQGANLFDAQVQGANLRRAQMHGAHLGGAQMQGADVGGAQMHGAILFGAQMQGAHLGRAQMQGAKLDGAQMQGADLGGAQMQGASLGGAQMQGADLDGVQMDDATLLTGATLRGAAVKKVDDTTIAQLRLFWGDIFADGSVSVPAADRPGRWMVEELRVHDFIDAWRAWQRSIGFDPDDPSSWDEQYAKDDSE